MAFTRENSIGNAIHSYSSGEIVIIQNTVHDGVMAANLKTINTNFIINPTSLISDWTVNNLEDLTEDSITQIVALAPEIVILGVGAQFVLPPISITLLFQKHKMGLEVMDTAAACRTYNFLLNEGRNVTAALIQIATG